MRAEAVMMSGGRGSTKKSVPRDPERHHANSASSGSARWVGTGEQSLPRRPSSQRPRRRSGAASALRARAQRSRDAWPCRARRPRRRRDHHAADRADRPTLLEQQEDGALAGTLRKGAIVVDMSSSRPAGTRELAARLGRRGVTLIDAPVSGGAGRGNRAARADGRLRRRGRARARASDPRCPRQEAVRGRGCGRRPRNKTLNNFMSGTGFLTAIEALVIGRRFGLDPGVMLDVINESTGRDFHTANVMRQEVISRGSARNLPACWPRMSRSRPTWRRT